MSKNIREYLNEVKLDEKLNWGAYLKDLGYDAKKYKKLDPHEYEFFKKRYMKSKEAGEFEQNYLEDLERSITKIKI